MHCQYYRTAEEKWVSKLFVERKLASFLTQKCTHRKSLRGTKIAKKKSLPEEVHVQQRTNKIHLRGMLTDRQHVKTTAPALMCKKGLPVLNAMLGKEIEQHHLLLLVVEYGAQGY